MHGNKKGTTHSFELLIVYLTIYTSQKYIQPTTTCNSTLVGIPNTKEGEVGGVGPCYTF